MRTLLLVGAGVALMASDGAVAQHAAGHGAGASYPMPGRGGAVVRGPVAAPPVVVHPMPGPAPIAPHPGGGRWGSRVDGRWWGGANAPGGWAAYRRPVRGYALPRYWVAPRFFVGDWQNYGFRAPGAGYNWVRYYDDAVLVDSRGSVYDSVQDVDWDRYDGGYADDRGERREVRIRERRDNGLGGAAIGAVAGGVAGNLIAGRGNRLGGTLIGAGVGGAAGYAIDRAEDRGRDRDWRRRDDRRGGYEMRGDYPPPPPPPGPGYGYPPPPGPGYDYPVAGEGPWVSPDGRTTVVTTGGGWGGSTTTVTVQSAPIVTTTVTEEVIEDRVVYRRPAKRTKIVRRSVKGCRC